MSALTISGKQDGFGTQLMAMLSGIAGVVSFSSCSTFGCSSSVAAIFGKITNQETPAEIPNKITPTKPTTTKLFIVITR